MARVTDPFDLVDRLSVDKRDALVTALTDLVINKLTDEERDTLLLRLLGSEGRYHYYPTAEQPDGTVSSVHL